jgi:hypothetical protein
MAYAISTISPGIGTYSLNAAGQCTSLGDNALSEWGTCYCLASAGDPTTSSSKSYHTGSKYDKLQWSDSITGLSSNTAYKVRAYGIESCTYSVYYGSVVSVTTLKASASVTTSAASSVIPFSFIGNGNITSLGDYSITRKGFCYKVGTSGDPTTSDSVAYDDGTFSTGSYTKSITGLTANTGYRVRAYIVSSTGSTFYGETVQVTTVDTVGFLIMF